MAHAIPTTDACGFAGCLTSSSTVLFTELVYSGSVNTSSGLPVNNYVLPQLTDYFPTGNPLRSCTTASLVAYTPNPQPALAKREAVAEPIPPITFPGVPSLTSTITYSAEANRVDPSLPSSSPVGDDNDGTTTDDNDTSTSSPGISSAVPPSSQQSAQTQESVQTTSETSDPPPTTTSEASDAQTPASTTAASTGDSAQNSDSALGTMSFTGTVAGTAGNSSSAQPSTWNFVCSSEGCTLASSSETSTTSSGASSTDTEAQLTTQSSSARVALSRSMGGVILMMMVLFAMF